ncbi:MAG TPA: hypothetical protein PK718_02940 [Candidatus Methanofastidiosa archaeon]|nr:hypothetical protein [Candidatus Methanofastidiosa archaeon]HPR41487.1 hypothetical protein [Candidatus Methanofastidiosa archaeon]
MKIGDIELSGLENLDTLIAKAKELYLWKMEAKPILKSENDIDLEKIFEGARPETPESKENEFFNV